VIFETPSRSHSLCMFQRGVSSEAWSGEGPQDDKPQPLASGVPTIPGWCTDHSEWCTDHSEWSPTNPEWCTNHFRVVHRPQSAARDAAESAGAGRRRSTYRCGLRAARQRRETGVRVGCDDRVLQARKHLAVQWFAWLDRVAERRRSTARVPGAAGASVRRDCENHP
jgi:hypothetical protein